MNPFLRSLSVLAVLPLFFSAQAQACPAQNENFFVSEYNGQENTHVGHIDTAISLVENNHGDFSIQEVQLNDVVLCSNATRAKICGNSVSLRNGALRKSDHVRVVMHSRYSDSGKQTFVFERFSAVEDSGYHCRPIWAR